MVDVKLPIHLKANTTLDFHENRITGPCFGQGSIDKALGMVKLICSIFSFFFPLKGQGALPGYSIRDDL
jgi:hypothetical protein